MTKKRKRENCQTILQVKLDSTIVYPNHEVPNFKLVYQKSNQPKFHAKHLVITHCIYFFCFQQGFSFQKGFLFLFCQERKYFCVIFRTEALTIEMDQVIILILEGSWPPLVLSQFQFFLKFITGLNQLVVCILQQLEGKDQSI